MAVAIAVLTFWLGVFSVLVVEAVLIYAWFVSKKVEKPPAIVETKPKLPQVVEEVARRISQDGSNAKETCQFLNIGLSFLFQELRDTLAVKRFVMRRIQKEFEDFMMAKTQGKIVEQLIVRNYSLGKQLPLFNSIQVVDVKRNGNLIENIDISLDVEYEGEAQICIDADLILGRCAVVSVKVCKVKGQGRLQFTCHPYTNWSFSFYETPELQLDVECLLDGRQFSQLSGFIESQIHKWVKKRHTLPNYRQRFVPFFPQPVPHDQRVEMYLHDKKLTVGQLVVELIECSHLSPVQCPAKLFCSLQLGEGPTQPLTGMWRMLWPAVECCVRKPSDGEPIGVVFAETVWREKEEEKHELVIIRSVVANSPAANAGICKGDVVYSINHMKVSNPKSAAKLLNKITTERFIFTLMKPPDYALSELLVRAQKKQHKHIAVTSTDGAEASVQDSDRLFSGSPNVKKKMGKNRLRHDDKQLSMFEHMDPNFPSESLVDTSSRRNSATEVKLRRQGTSVGEYSMSFDENHKNSKEQLSRSASVFSSRSSVDHVDPLLINSNPPMDCIDTGATNQRRTDDHSSCRTSKKPASQNPCWDEKFTFSVLPNHRYLNIVLWCKVEDEKDYAVAHVSISLVDIAIECLSNSLCTHTQRYVMLPNEPMKFGSSRSVIKLTGSRGNIVYEGVHGGDILLRLTHYTEQRAPPDLDTNITEPVDLSDHQGASDCSDEEAMFSGEHVLLQNEPAEWLKTDHEFRPTELKNMPARCVICKKKFWRHRVLQCVHCDLFCHKKCTVYCMMQVPCYRRTSGYNIVKDSDVSNKMRKLSFERSLSTEQLGRELADSDNNTPSTTGEHDFERSIDSTYSKIGEHDFDFEHSIQKAFFSGSETESEGEFFEEPLAVHKEHHQQRPSEQFQRKGQIQDRLSLILGEMDVIKGTYNELGKTKPLNVVEANSINASQENLTIKLDSLKQEMLQCYEELNRLDEDNIK